MSSSSFLIAALLLLPAGVGLAVLAVNEEPEQTERSRQEEAGFRSRVFGVSPTHSSDDREEDSEAAGERAADPTGGQWLSDRLARLEESYQAMRQQGEDLAQEAMRTWDGDAPPESSPDLATPPRLSAALPEAAPAAQPAHVLPATDAAPHDQGVEDESGDLVAQDGAAVDQTALTHEVGASDQAVLASASNLDTTQPAAAGEVPLSPEEAARAEQLRIAVALEKHQAFIISLLPLFLPIPAAADASVPQAAVPAGPIPVVDMSGIAWGPVDRSGTPSP